MSGRNFVDGLIMSLRSWIILLLGCYLFGCNFTENNGEEKKKTSKEMTYSFACLDSTVSGKEINKALKKGGDFIRDLAVDEESVTDKVQNEYGAAFHQDAIESKTFKLANDATIQAQLDKIMKDLLAAREKPSNIQYHIYLIEDPQINAFTFGGRIYLTTGMYKKTEGQPSLLYAIIGHEIGHSEKGHIKKTIQEMKLSEQIFGDNGIVAFQIKKMLTGSFNQQNELEADYYGTDLTYRLDQDVCSAVSFWRDMAKNENTYSQLEDFFRTHPFSALRAECLQSHIRNNFNKNCIAQ
jgi:beta-barrel assembly-enhancing protease